MIVTSVWDNPPAVGPNISTVVRTVLWDPPRTVLTNDQRDTVRGSRRIGLA